MVSIRQRAPYQWQATVRKSGFPTQCKTFEHLRDAKDWAKIIESEMRRGVFIDRSEAESTTLRELLERYSEEVTPTKLGKAPRTLQAQAVDRTPHSTPSSRHPAIDRLL